MAAQIDDIDKIFGAFAAQRRSDGPTIACLYTGQSFPSSCAPMALSPSPPTGMYLEDTFGEHLASALACNPASHDGAVMFGRVTNHDRYRITGWSFRLFPEDLVVETIPNRGSAFNSCLAMSVVTGVDRLYVLSRDEQFRFRNGKAKPL